MLFKIHVSENNLMFEMIKIIRQKGEYSYMLRFDKNEKKSW